MCISRRAGQLLCWPRSKKWLYSSWRAEAVAAAQQEASPPGAKQVAILRGDLPRRSREIARANVLGAHRRASIAHVDARGTTQPGTVGLDDGETRVRIACHAHGPVCVFAFTDGPRDLRVGSIEALDVGSSNEEHGLVVILRGYASHSWRALCARYRPNSSGLTPNFTLRAAEESVSSAQALVLICESSYGCESFGTTRAW